MIGEYTKKPLQGAMLRKLRYQIMVVIPAADPGPRKVKLEHLRKSKVIMISMVPPGNDVTAGVCWVKLRIKWNNFYHPYRTHETGTNTLM